MVVPAMGKVFASTGMVWQNTTHELPILNPTGAPGARISLHGLSYHQRLSDSGLRYSHHLSNSESRLFFLQLVC